jgi:hypothetical protein
LATLLVLPGFLAAKAVSAQALQPRPTVTRAADLIEPYPARVPLGTEVVFQSRTSASAQALARQGIQVRAFALRGSEARPASIGTIGECDVYLTTVLKLEILSNGRLRFANMNKGWINLSNRGDTIREGRWFLVFERAGAPESQFRIRSSDAADYFSTGFELAVYDNQTVPIEEIRVEWNRRRAADSVLYAELDLDSDDAPCYSYRPIRASLEQDVAAALPVEEPCVPAFLLAEAM